MKDKRPYIRDACFYTIYINNYVSFVLIYYNKNISFLDPRK